MIQLLTGEPATLDFEAAPAGDPAGGVLQLTPPFGDPVEAAATRDDSVYTVELEPFEHPLLYSAVLTFDDETIPVDDIEVVGAFLYTVEQARIYDGKRLSDSARYPPERIEAARRRAADKMEADTGRSWIPRYRRALFAGDGNPRLRLWNAAGRTHGASGGEGARRDLLDVLAVEIDGEPVDGEPEAVGDSVYLPSVPARSHRPNIVVHYSYGRPHVAEEADEMALLLTSVYLPPSTVGTRSTQDMTTFSDDWGTTSWEPENNSRPSRIPRYNAWVRAKNVPLLYA